MDNDFNFDDLDIDTGVDTSDMDGFDIESSDETIDFGDTTLNSTEIKNDGVKSVKKTAIISATAGFVVIIIALTIISSINGMKNSSNKGGDKTTVNYNVGKLQNNPSQNIDKTSGNSNNTSVNLDDASITPNNTSVNSRKSDNTSETSWKEFTQGLENDIDNVISSNFTVTSIQHFAKVVNDKNVVIVRSVVKGNISGLVGTYEIVLPYKKARYLKIGSVFDIKYHYVVENGIMIIDEIEY